MISPFRCRSDFRTKEGWRHLPCAAQEQVYQQVIFNNVPVFTKIPGACAQEAQRARQY